MLDYVQKMNVMKKRFSFRMIMLLTAIIMVSCSDKVYNNSLTFVPLDGVEANGGSFKDYLKMTTCIPIEEPTDYHIDRVTKVEVYNGDYYVLCASDIAGLMVFNKNGKFVRKISRKGNGRGEYMRIFDFTIDRKNKRILMLCDNASNVRIYDMSGKYIDSKLISDVSFRNIACINGKILCTTDHQGFTKSNNLFYLFDEKFNLVKSGTEVSDNSMGVTSLIPSCLKVYGDKFVYSDFYTHTLYVLNDDGEIEKGFQYEKESLMPMKYFKNFKSFEEKQFKYDFVFNNALYKDKCITSYKNGRSMQLSICESDGKKVVNRTLTGVCPDFVGYDGEQIVTVLPLDMMKSMYPNNIKTDSTFFYIVKYKLK